MPTRSLAMYLKFTLVTPLSASLIVMLLFSTLKGMASSFTSIGEQILLARSNCCCMFVLHNMRISPNRPPRSWNVMEVVCRRTTCPVLTEMFNLCKRNSILNSRRNQRKKMMNPKTRIKFASANVIRSVGTNFLSNRTDMLALRQDPQQTAQAKDAGLYRFTILT
mmetsp:Transcript_47794/g.149807  ORF Transcript_47794/g.149807 Transcript_47794/m.149807 type:complete len:165 (+) Transcript_47794:1193-1687(+)